MERRPGRLPTGVVIGSVFGLAYVLVNAVTLPTAIASFVRLAGVLAFVGVFVVGRRAHLPPPPHPRRFTRDYWLVVAAEVTAIMAGVVLLSGPLDAPDAAVAWISVVVGMHFLALTAVWHSGAQTAWGGLIAAFGIAGLAAAAAGASAAFVATVAGVVPGFVLLGAGYWGLWSANRANAQHTYMRQPSRGASTGTR